MMISLKLHVLEGFSYTAGCLSFPVVAEVSCDQSIMLAQKIDVRELTLTPLGATSENDFFGVFRRPGFGLPPQAVFELTPKRNKFISYDVFQWEIDSVDGYSPGSYRLRLVIDIFEKHETNFEVKTLVAEKLVEVGE